MDFSWGDGVGIFYYPNNQVKEIEIYSPNSAFYMQGVDIFLLTWKN